ncbi:MAG: NAD(P)/FAD-dependent oxidoreductase [Polyangiaceae bacterium]
MKFDAVIAGGGPGGSIFAAQLARRGRSALVLEKVHHPRFHLGESLLPQSMPILKKVGIYDAVASRFMMKRGATFHESGTLKQVRYDFGEAFDKSTTFAFQVPRDEFDQMLFEHARTCGADVREGWKVTKIDGSATATGGASIVTAKDEAGTEHTFECALAVDATGRDAMMAHVKHGTTRVPELDKTAVFSMWDNAWRDTDDREGDIQIIVFGEGDETGWFWSIPFKDGRTSVGAVLSSAWLKRRRMTASTVPELYALAIAESPAMQRIVDGATQLMEAQAMADFSYRVRDLFGPGWIAVGDAGGFIDPLFSTGAHLAMYGGLHAADTLADALSERGTVTPEDFTAWSALMRSGAELFLGSVQAFYRGTLTPYLFSDAQHPFLRHAITSMLAGDVFTGHDRWMKEMRARFPAALQS